MSTQLIGERIAVLVDDGVDSDELAQLRRSLSGAAASVVVLSVPSTPVLAIDACGVVDHVTADASLGDLRVEDYSALIIPSGRGPHAQLRYHAGVTRGLRTAVDRGAVVATGRSATGVLVAAGLVRGRRVTSGPGLRHELRQAGARWLDVAVARENGVLTTQRADTAGLAWAVADEVAARSAGPVRSALAGLAGSAALGAGCP